MSAAKQRIEALEAQGFSREEAERAVQRVMATMSLFAQNTMIGFIEMEDAARRDLQRVLEMV